MSNLIIKFMNCFVITTIEDEDDASTLAQKRSDGVVVTLGAVTIENPCSTTQSNSESRGSTMGVPERVEIPTAHVKFASFTYDSETSYADSGIENNLEDLIKIGVFGSPILSPENRHYVFPVNVPESISSGGKMSILMYIANAFKECGHFAEIVTSDVSDFSKTDSRGSGEYGNSDAFGSSKTVDRGS